MIEKITGWVVEKQLKANMIERSDIEVYRYGYTLILEVAINVVIAFIIGIVLNELMTVAIFLSVFIPIRKYGGGYHAATSWRCVILSNACVAIVSIYCKLNNIEIATWLFIFTESVCAICIWFLAPVDSENKPLNETEKNTYRNKTRIILIIEVILEMLTIKIGIFMIRDIILMAHCILSVSLIGGTLARTRLSEAE